jgi:uncharacterized protein (TIGR02646 family)
MIRMIRLLDAKLATWKRRADKERLANIERFETGRKTKKPAKDFGFKFNVYGDPSLRDALNDVYFFKCAYCESSFKAVGPVQVEHYRPKGAILDGTRWINPGYYWLAADWDNLLPSCIDCNSPRYHKEEDGEERLRGKANYFPILKGKRAREPGKEIDEFPALLHPERDEPEQHLRFGVTDDDIGYVFPARLKGKLSERGKASIKYYALDRTLLTETRADVALRLRFVVETARERLRTHERYPRDAGARKLFLKAINELRTLNEIGQPYLAMKRAILRKEFPGFEKLVNQLHAAPAVARRRR